MMTVHAAVPTFGFQPTADLMTVLTAGHSRSAAHVVLSDMHPSAPTLSRELDALFARGASEAEIAEFRKREAEILGVDA